jgi:hypothetical protein
MPRSGSTIFDLMVGQLPCHCDVGELFYLWQAGLLRNQLCACGEPFHSCPFWREVGQSAFGGWESISAHEVLALQGRVDTTARLALASLGGLVRGHAADVRRYLDLTTAIYRAISEVSRATVVVDSTKRPSTAYLLAKDPRVDLRVAHVVRDPRGVVNSWSREVVLPDRAGARSHIKRRRLSQIARRWVTVNLMIEGLSARGVPLQRVRYEDLVTDPAATMRDILGLWGLQADQDSLSFLTSAGVTTGASHAVAGGRVRLRRGPLKLQLDEAWRRELPGWKRGATIAVTGPLMRRYGYR